jgi:hypothetical protein
MSSQTLLCCAVLYGRPLIPLMGRSCRTSSCAVPCPAVCPPPSRRQFDLTLGLDTLTPITTIHERVKVWGEQSGKHIDLQVRPCTWGGGPRTLC